jgi:hypothetical protein
MGKYQLGILIVVRENGHIKKEEHNENIFTNT